MSSKTLNKRMTKKRSVKNTSRQKQKQMHNYLLGGGKYTKDKNMQNAYTEVFNVSPPDAALHWLKEAHKEKPNEKDIEEFIEKLETSGRLLKEVQTDIEKLIE